MKILRLTQRDLDLLGKLGDHRFLDVRQVSALLFPSENAARHRLQELLAHRLVHRLYMPVRPYDPRAVQVYALSAKGARHVPRSRADAARPATLSTSDRRSGLFLDHTLKRNDVRIALERLGETHSKFTMFNWKQRREDVEFRTTDVRGRRQRIVPDGVAYVRVGSEVEVFPIEIDLGTVRLPKMTARYKGYWRDFTEGGPRVRHGPVPYRVLTITNSPARLEALRTAAQRAPTRGRRGSRLFWFALLDDLDIHEPTKLLCPIWTHAGYRPDGATSTREPLFPNLDSSQPAYDLHPKTTLPPTWRRSEVPPSPALPTPATLPLR
ncbi:MAG: replication-relaxation family protein [Thermoanaerobaculia bacterium]|jgi:hypothetical protein